MLLFLLPLLCIAGFDYTIKCIVLFPFSPYSFPSHFRRVLRQRPSPPTRIKLMFTSRAARLLAAVWRTSRDCHCRTVEWESSFAESGMRLAVKLLH